MYLMESSGLPISSTTSTYVQLAYRVDGLPAVSMTKFSESGGAWPLKQRTLTSIMTLARARANLASTVRLVR